MKITRRQRRVRPAVRSPPEWVRKGATLKREVKGQERLLPTSSFMNDVCEGTGRHTMGNLAYGILNKARTGKPLTFTEKEADNFLGSQFDTSREMEEAGSLGLIVTIGRKKQKYGRPIRMFRPTPKFLAIIRKAAEKR